MARRSLPALLIAALGFLTLPGPAAAQAAADPNPGNLTLIGNVDLTNAYMFRGIRQDDTRIIVQPSAEMDITLQSASSGLKSTSLNFGTWNSLHTGDAGLRSATSGLGCACNKVWYESDFYTTLAFGFTGGSLGITYTAYTSPNAGFNNVKELMFKFGGDDSSALGKAALHPWAIAAFEFDADNGHQADGGANAGKYLELGVSPGFSGANASVAVPIKVGLSIGDYYELNEGTAARPDFVDHKFGYFSIAGILTVPLGGTTSYGAWNFHAGVEYQKLGDTTKAFNNGDSSKVIGSAGLGFTY
ncbi:MAG TPA: TorF family putative porin [Vicinamibacterales bacterium]|jgi:hypothetical protein|nr:TorF family putative porin [Vicinamibacterales bacterium]